MDSLAKPYLWKNASRREAFFVMCFSGASVRIC